MRISFIIPAHNEERYIGPCLDSVIKNSRGQFTEIIVIDNASGDRTAEVARQTLEVQIVREEQKGLCHARERGRATAIGDFLAYIDADSRLPEDWIDITQQVFRDYPEAVCLSGPPIYFDAAPLQNFLLRGLWRISAPLTYRAIGYMVYGANFVVKRSALDAIGGFNREIQFYGEDTDVARRLRTMGKVLFRMDFRILTSARRFSAMGLFKTSAVYALNYLWVVLFQKPFSTHYRDVR